MFIKSKLINQKFNNSKGFSLIEVIVAIFVATLIGIAAVSLLNARAVSVGDKTVLQDAETRAEEALSALTAVAADLPTGGSFTVATDNTITLSSCTDQNCDYVLIPDITDSQRLSNAKGYKYSSTIPTGSQKYFLRRWRVEDLPGNYNLRKITVAILKDEQSIEPFVLEDTVVGVNR